MATTAQPTAEQIELLGRIWGLNRDWEILERVGRNIGMRTAHVRKGRLTYADMEAQIERTLAKRGMQDPRKTATDISDHR